MATKKYKEIDFAGKKLPVFYGLKDISRLEQDPEKIRSNAVGYFLDVIWKGVQSGYKKKGADLDISKEEFNDLIDDAPDAFGEAIQYFKERQSRFFGWANEKKTPAS